VDEAGPRSVTDAESCQIVHAALASRIKLLQLLRGLFYRYGIEKKLVRIQQRHVLSFAQRRGPISSTRRKRWWRSTSTAVFNFGPTTTSEETCLPMKPCGGQVRLSGGGLPDLGGRDRQTTHDILRRKIAARG